VIAILNSTAPAIRRMLLDLFGMQSKRGMISKLREAERELRDIRAKAWDEGFELVLANLIDMAKAEPQEFRQATGAKLAGLKLSKIETLVATALAAGHNLKEWFKAMSEADIRRAIGQVRIAVLAGEPLSKLFSRLSGKVSTVAVVANNGVKGLLATMVGAVSDTVRRSVLGVNAKTFDYEQWVSILDSRTTEGCRRLDGKVFPVGEGPMPGYHHWCRSIRVPFREDGGRHVAENYADWQGNQPADFVAYAGNTFRVTELSPLTLAQVHRLDQAA
jgi:hypothetical protein